MYFDWIIHFAMFKQPILQRNALPRPINWLKTSQRPMIDDRTNDPAVEVQEIRSNWFIIHALNS